MRFMTLDDIINRLSLKYNKHLVLNKKLKRGPIKAMKTIIYDMYDRQGQRRIERLLHKEYVDVVTVDNIAEKQKEYDLIFLDDLIDWIVRYNNEEKRGWR